MNLGSNEILDYLQEGFKMNLHLDPDKKLSELSPRQIIAQGRFHLDYEKGINYFNRQTDEHKSIIDAFIDKVLEDKSHVPATNILGSFFTFEHNMHGHFLTTTIRKTNIVLFASQLKHMRKGDKKVRFSDNYDLNGNSNALSEVSISAHEKHSILLFRIDYKNAIRAAISLAVSRQWTIEN